MLWSLTDSPEDRDGKMEEVIDRGVAAATADLCGKTALVGGDCVLDLCVNAERSGEQGLILGVTATGTAVKTDRFPQEKANVPQDATQEDGMLVTTTPSVEGWRVAMHHGVIHSYVILLPAAVEDLRLIYKEMIGGRNRKYEAMFDKGTAAAIASLSRKAKAKGANAVIGVKASFEHAGGNGSVLMAAVTGTAVSIEKIHRGPGSVCGKEAGA